MVWLPADSTSIEYGAYPDSSSNCTEIPSMAMFDLATSPRLYTCPSMTSTAKSLKVSRSEAHTYEPQSLIRISYAVFYLTKKIVTRFVLQIKTQNQTQTTNSPKT